MRLILETIKALFRKVEAKIPKKLSDLANDLKFPTPDWNENDPKGEGYIKNRPFYEEYTEITCVKEQTVVIDESGYADIERDPESWPPHGSPFEVLFDGVSYKGTVYEDGEMCTHTDFTTKDGYDITVIDAAYLHTSADLAGEHTIKIAYTNVTAHIIDEKYLPEQKVMSVNGKTGYVSLSASDIGAASSSSVNYKMDKSNPVGTGSFSIGRKANTSVGSNSYAVGNNVTASGSYSHAEGSSTTASGNHSHAEGSSTTASGIYSHAEGGLWTKASGEASHAEGSSTTASGNYSHAEGCHTTASGTYSHAEGNYTTSSGFHSHTEGDHTTVIGTSAHAQGRYNIIDEYVDQNTRKGTYAHIVGNGNSETERSNAHTLDWSGNATFAGVVTGTGADYAEYFEWTDGNPNSEDRVGSIVTLDGEKIRLANAGDEILGVVTGTAMVLGDNAEWEWRQKYLVDDYGRVLTEMVEEFYEETDPETGEVTKTSLGFFPHRKLNPDYDPEQKYARRCDRKEWETIGLLGKIHVTDDGTCVVGGYATVADGSIATASTEKTNMRVMKRITDNIVLVLLK